jgi:glutathione S-transferase
MKLYIGNKNYSSWSMRPWVLMREFGIPFTEVMLRFDTFEPDSAFKQAILKVSPAGRVPTLVMDDGQAVWDSLAIAETLADQFPDKALWPKQASARARARSLSCEMHSGFGGLRGTFPMNIEATLHEVGKQQLGKVSAAAADLKRIDALWCDALKQSGGPFLLGAYSIADAMYAPVVARVRTYGLPLSQEAKAYADRLWATQGVQAWVKEALDEKTFVAVDEPYRTSR